MFDRLDPGHQAILVQPVGLYRAAADGAAEFQELTLSAGIQPAAIVRARAAKPHPATFLGRGKVAEIAEQLDRFGVKLVLVNHILTPAQERNLEKLLQARVLDRTTLILDIFAQRARTFEGKLQVELAQLRHLSTRLVRGWTHLERQKGGIGLRGPGETQLETDRRLLMRRIRHLRGRLEKVRKRRAESRRGRARSDVPVVALVGYTNAGKSTLFNALTGARAQVAHRLFATLDPTLRRLDAKGSPVVLADTVGFIRHLPHELVAAFRATLEETREADLLLHVIDVAAADRSTRMRDVETVLEEIGAAAVPRLHVYNKIDLKGMDERLDHDAHGQPERVWVSARSGAGLELLKQSIFDRLATRRLHRQIHLAPEQGRLHARLHELGAVVEEHAAEDGGWRMEVELPADQAGQLPGIGNLSWGR